LIGATLIVITVATAGCSDESNPAPPSDGPGEQSSRSLPAPPSASMSPSVVLNGDLRYQTFAKIVKTSGLSKQLDSAKNLTIFAPLDESFAALGSRSIERLTSNREAAAAVVRRHAVSESASINDLLNRRKPLKDLAGDPVEATFDASNKNGPLRVGGAPVTSTEVPTKNGYLLVTSEIIPPSK